MSCSFPKCRCEGRCSSPFPSAVVDWSGHECLCCGLVMYQGDTNRRRRPSRDYITPLAQGGMKHPINALVSCLGCKGDRSGLSLSEWLDDLVWNADPRANRVRAFLAQRKEAA